MNELALFAGGGGGLYASLLLGHTPVCAVEIEPTNRRMLLQRQLDGIFPKFPIWDDVRTFDGKPWQGKIDLISGGFPCQDISSAGTGTGLSGARSGLWHEMARIIGEIRPQYAFIENSPMLTIRGLERVLCDLAALGYDAEWGIVGAHHVGAPHKRERIWIVAYYQRNRCERKEWSRTHRETRTKTTERCGCTPNPNQKRRLGRARSWQKQNRRRQPENNDSQSICHTQRIRCHSRRHRHNPQHDRTIPAPTNRWPHEPDICRVAHGVADWKHRIFALGNGQVPRVAATAWTILKHRLEHPHEQIP